MHWYLEALKKYVDFDGRAGRMEFWVFFLVNSVICGLLLVPAAGTRLNAAGERVHAPFETPFPDIALAFFLAMLLPMVAVTARRLHDTGRTAGWIALLLAPGFGHLILLILMLPDSQPGDNVYGQNPKGVETVRPAQ